MAGTDPPTAALDRKTLLALLEASRAVNEQDNLDKVFAQVTHSAATLLRAEAASLLTLDVPATELVFRTAVGPAAAALRGRRMPADAGIAGQAVRTGRPTRVDDVRRNRNFFSEIDDDTATRTRSLIAAPIIDRQRTLGVIEVLNPAGRAQFSDDDLRLLEIFANLVASAMRAAEDVDRLSRGNRALSATRGVRALLPFIGRAPVFRRTVELCERVAPAATTVLLLGETGTGKEVAARLVHEKSLRKDQPFVAVNCAAVSETLLESELFGHEKGAFTGAEKDRRGWFQVADGGTLFLDEVGEMSLPTQAKLLRVLQERAFTRVGGSELIACDVRIIAATNRDLRSLIAQGKFREDLFYRLNVFPIELPPLRSRRDDIAELVSHFCESIAREMSIRPPRCTDDALRAMSAYSWPGNIRELRNIIERCALLCDGEITCDHLPREIVEGRHDGTETPAAAGQLRHEGFPPPSQGGGQGVGGSPGIERPFHPHPIPPPQGGGGCFDAPPSTLDAHERSLLLRALEETHWNQSAAARALGITRDVLRYRMKKHEIERAINK